MTILTISDLQYIDEEIAILEADNNFRKKDYWEQYKSFVRKQYEAWKNKKEIVSEVDLELEAYNIITRKKNFDIEIFRDEYSRTKMRDLVIKYKTQNVTISRAARYLKLDSKKRVGGQYESAVKRIESFVTNFCDDISIMSREAFRRKHGLSKYLTNKIYEFKKGNKNENI